MQRMALREDFREFFGPVGLQLFLEQLLRSRQVRHSQEGFTFFMESDASLIKLPVELVPTIEAEIHLKREPCLQPQVHESKSVMF